MYPMGSSRIKDFLTNFHTKIRMITNKINFFKIMRLQKKTLHSMFSYKLSFLITQKKTFTLCQFRIVSKVWFTKIFCIAFL